MKKIDEMNTVELFEHVTSLATSVSSLNDFERRELFDAALVQLLANVEIVG